MQLCRPYIYGILALGALVLVAMELFTRVEFLTSIWLPDTVAAGQALLLWLALGMLGRKLGGDPKMLRIARVVVEAIFLAYVMSTVLRLLDHATKAFAPKWADPVFARLDQMMGLDWLAYFDWIHAHDALHPLMIWSYEALNSATAAIVLGLLFLGQSTRLRAFVEAFVICAVISVIFGAFVPGRGAVDFWVSDMALYPNFTSTPGVYPLPALEMLRAPEGPIVIGSMQLVGLVTFPSLHTGIGVLIMLASLRTWLWVPAWAYGGVMIASTPIWGGHYFIDLLGGAVMAVTVWLLVMKNLTHRSADVSQALPAATLTPAE